MVVGKLKPHSDFTNLFHLNTKQSFESDDRTEIQGFTSFPGRKEIFVKEKIYLEKTPVGNNTLFQSLINRESSKNTGIRIPLKLSDVSDILIYSYSSDDSHDSDSEYGNFIKTVPSAGGRYPLSLYLIAFNILGIEQGIYYWDPFQKNLGLMRRGNFRNSFKETITSANAIDVDYCSFAIAISANVEQTCEKYGSRGYRHVCMDVGYVSQNLYLTSNHLGVSTRAIAGYYDESLAEFIRSNDNDQMMLVHLFGKENISADKQLKLSSNAYFK